MTKGGPSTYPEFEARLRFETMIADLSSRFVNLPAGEVDREIMDAQRPICELLGLDLAALWQWSDEAPGFFTLTHFYSAHGDPLPPGHKDREDFPWIGKEMRAGRILAVSSLDELPPEAARDRETFRQSDFKSSLIMPLSVAGGTPIGALSFTTRTEREWPDVLVKRLQLVAQIFANALARKCADHQLRESEELLITSLDAAGAGAWSIELKTRRVWASASERKLFGLQADEPLTIDSFMRVIHPDDRETVRKAIEDAIRTKARLFVEYHIILPDGSVRWISARGQCSHSAKGEPDRLLGVSVDITERKRFEEALRQRGQYIETVLEQAPIGFAVHTIDDGVGRFVSARYEEIYGVRRGTIDSHHTFFDKVWPDHPLLRADIRRRVVADMTSGDSLRMRWEYVPVPLPSGEIRYITAMNIPVPDQNLMVSTVQDVTRQVLAEKALRESEERFRHVVESTGDFVWEVDAQGTYTFAGPAVEGMLGYTPEELVGKKRFYDLIDPAVREELKAAALRVFADKRAFRDFPNPNVSKSGKIVHLETSGVPVLDSAGNLTGYRGTDSDVTERKRAEKTMQELSGRLITAQEDERRRLARELHDDITQRLACLAIDAGRVERGVSDAALATPMRQVREGLIRLSEDIHSLSYRLHPALLEDLGLIEALRAEGERFARQESMPVELRCNDVPDLVSQAPALCLFRVAQEALRNAGRHSRARKVELSLRGLDSGLQLAVRDDGCGFDPALHRERASLGLASMRERVRLLAGELDIESAPGHGTTILAWVPLEKAKG